MAVIGSAAAAALFPGGEDPIDQRIFIAGQPFAVIGVMTPREMGFLQSPMLEGLWDDDVYLPFAIGWAQLFQDHGLDMTVRIANPAQLEQTARRIYRRLLVRHGADSFYLNTRSGTIDEWPLVHASCRRPGQSWALCSCCSAASACSP